MRILSITATKRKSGNSIQAIEYISKKLSAENEILNLAEFDIEPCKACYACLYGVECKIEDEVYAIYEKLRNVDALLIVSPTYWLDATARIKALLDRSFMAIPYLDDFSRVRSAIITLHGFNEMRGWASSTHNVLARVLGTDLLVSVEIHAALPGEIFTKEENMKKLDMVVDALKNNKKIVGEGQCPVCLASSFRVEDGKIRCLLCNSILDCNMNVVRSGEMFSSHEWLKNHYEELRELKEEFRIKMDELKRAKAKYLGE